MKLMPVFGVVVALGALGGCSSDEGSDSGGPVAASPLKGTIAGKEFVAKIAVASPGFDDNDPEKSISIYDVDTDCNGRGGDRSILTSIEWKAGLSKNLKLDFSGGDNQTVTFVTGPGQNVVSNSGRIEIIEAPTEANAKGKLRLRASANDNSVEGEIPVLVCGKR